MDMHNRNSLKAVLAVILLVVLATQGIPTNAVAEVLNISAEGQAQQNEPQKTEGQDAPAKQGEQNEPNGSNESGQDSQQNEQENRTGQQDGQDQQSQQSDQNGAGGQGERKQGPEQNEQQNNGQQGENKDQGNKDQQGEGNKGDATQKPAAASDAKDGKASSDSKSDSEQKEDKNADDQESEEDSDSKPTFPAINTTEYANGLAVRINALEGAFPANTVVRVQPANVEKFMANAGDFVEGDPVDARAVDICFIHDGSEIEPREGTSVLVDLQPIAPVNGTSFAAVHVADNGVAEVVDSNATKEGASFEATDFSVYGIVGGSVIQGENEQYTRLEVVFRNGSQNGAVLSTQIVRAGDSLAAPTPSSNEQGKVFHSWRAGDKEVDNKYLTNALTEQDIEAMISTYGATAVDDATNLWQLDVAANYQAGYHAYFHWSPKGTAESGIIAGILNSSADGTVRLGDILDVYSPSTTKSKVIGWVDDAGKEYALDATPTLTGDTHFYPVTDGKWIDLEMNGAPVLEDVYAKYDSAKKKYLVKFDDLPNATVQSATFYPGYTFDGWYLTKDGDTYSSKFESGTAELDATQNKVYAKWNAKTNVKYTIAYMVEDESGTPGKGAYRLKETLPYTGKAGTAIPEDIYKYQNYDYYHYCTKANDGESDYSKSNEDEKTIIKGDGTTIKPVYYNANRIKLECTPTTLEPHASEQILPDAYVKSGEEIAIWLNTPGYDKTEYFDRYVYSANVDQNKRYVENTAVGYSFTGKETTIPYTEAAKNHDKYPVQLTAFEGNTPVRSLVTAKFYYEALEGQTGTEVTVGTETRTFVWVRDESWGSMAQYADPADEHFGFTYENGGLVEWAYKGSPICNDGGSDTGEVRLIPYNDTTVMPTVPGKIKNNYRYSKYYYDHYFTRTPYNLTFHKLVKESDAQNRTVKYGETLERYLPAYTKDTTRVVDGVTYTFAGWFLDESAADNPDDPDSKAIELPENAKMPASEVNLYAGWRAETHTVTYDAQGGIIKNTEGGKDVNKGTYEIQVKSGKGIDVGDRPDEVTCAGKVFGGWYLDKSLDTPLNYNTFTAHDNTTVYARWIDGKPCKITYYDADGHALEKPNNTYLKNSMVKLDGAPEPTHNGLPFLGWGTKKGDVSSLVPNDYVIVDDVNLYAIYGNTTVAGGPKITLHANYPDSTYDVTAGPISVKPDTANGEVTLPSYESVAFTCPKGYRFVGWGADAQGSARIYAAGKPVGVHENTDLYAIWKKEPTSGKLIQEIKNGNYGFARVTQTDDEIAEAIPFTDEEIAAMKNGASARFWIEAVDVTSTLDDATKDAMHSATSAGYVPGVYLDVIAWLQVGNAQPHQLHHLSKTLSVIFLLSSKHRAVRRNYEVVRNHIDVTERIGSSYARGCITMDSDRFSLFEVAYDGGVTMAASTRARSSWLARTGDPTNALLWAGVLAAGALVIGVGIYWRRRRG